MACEVAGVPWTLPFDKLVKGSGIIKLATYTPELRAEAVKLVLRDGPKICTAYLQSSNEREAKKEVLS